MVMFLNKGYACFFLLAWVLLGCQPEKEKIKRTQDFNFNWKFSLQEDIDASPVDYDDATWHTLNLPHDWSVEFPFDSIQGEGCTGYLPGGMGWYRKHFQAEIQEDQMLFLLFDGIYNNAEIWLNGQNLGERPYGYAPFYFDLTPHLKSDGDNILTVKVDRSRNADSRWYPGAGIYRNVELITVNKLHIPVWGTFVSTPRVSREEADISIQISLKNDFDAAKEVEVKTEIVDADGVIIAETNSNSSLSPHSESVLKESIQLSNPEIWDINTPNMYHAITSIFLEGKKVDEYTTPFGIRSFRFDNNEGFFLNGKNMKIKGVCLHHDGGLVGAAVPKGVWRRRLQTLKEGGCNAIRISHNPGSQEFLDLCDEMGFLVQDEFFDEWDNPKDKRLNMNERHDDYDSRGYAEHFQTWAEQDLKNTVLAHRNHPSIIQWSIGNEIEWTYPRAQQATGFFDNLHWSGNYFWAEPPFSPEQIKETYAELPEGKYAIEKTAQKLADWTRDLDTTRPIIANCILPASSLENGYADALDIVGFSYRRVMYDYAHKHHPNRIIMGTENLAQWHEWKAIMERPFVSGTFLWTGIDYMGEANEGWPRKGSGSGMIDLAGFPKPSYHMMKSLWTQEPHIFMGTQELEKSIYQVNEAGNVTEKEEGAWEQALWAWHPLNQHWNYVEDETIMIELLSNCEEIELFLEEKSLGKKLLADFPDHIYKWAVPFTSGKIIAKGTRKGKIIQTELTTAFDPVGMSVEVDKSNLQANGYDVAHIVVQLMDQAGNPVKHAEREITFEIAGNIKRLGVDNGSVTNVQPFQADRIITSKGRALLVVQAGLEVGDASITVRGEGLRTQTIALGLSPKL